MSAAILLRNRNFVGLLTSNTIFGLAFPVQLILGGLAGLMVAPRPELATLPSSMQTFAGLVAAAPISLLMGRLGRRAGFAFGGIATLVGSLGAVAAVFWQSFFLLCLSHFLMGAGWAAFQYFRFAAGEAVAEKWRPVAISLMLSALLVAAFAGPQIFISARDLLSPVPFAGAYLAIGLISLLGLLPLLAVRLPLRSGTEQATGQRLRAGLSALSRPDIRRAVAIAAVSQGIMVFLMIPTPIAMVACGFSEETASDVIRWHIVAMFAPSFFTGFLIKRFGALRLSVLGLILILLAAVVAASGLSAGQFYGGLILLGLGWNFAFIGATTLLDAAVSEDEKAAVQGANDTIIALVSTVAAFSAGLVVSTSGWTVLAIASGGWVLLAFCGLAADRSFARDLRNSI